MLLHNQMDDLSKKAPISKREEDNKGDIAKRDTERQNATAEGRQTGSESDECMICAVWRLAARNGKTERRQEGKPKVRAMASR